MRTKETRQVAFYLTTKQDVVLLQLGSGSRGNIQSNRPPSPSPSPSPHHHHHHHHPHPPHPHPHPHPHPYHHHHDYQHQLYLIFLALFCIPMAHPWPEVSDPRCFKKPAMPAEPSRCAMLVFAAPSTTLDPVLGDKKR